MAGYAAVITLNNTIQHLLNSSIIPPSLEVLQINHELGALEEILERLEKIEVSKSMKKVNALDGRIKEAVWEFEDLLESHLRNNILASQLSIDLQCLQHDADSFIQKLKEMQEEYINELNNMPTVEADELVSSEFDSTGTKSEMVGLCREYEKVREYLTGGYSNNVVLLGMPGIGKTTFAKKLFEDPEVSRCFENHRVWVNLGRNYEMEEIAGDVLGQLDPSQGEKLKERLKGKRCLIVLDDVWDWKVVEDLLNYLPDPIDDGWEGKIMVTSRLPDGIIPRTRTRHKWKYVQIRLLNMDESRELLRKRVFGDAGFPSSDLKEAAEKIAKKCEGLPLMILRVAHRLSEADPQYWNEVATKKRSSVFMEAYDEISEVLFPTYDCLLPQHVKMLFINAGAFPHDYEIPMSKFIDILTAERFTQANKLISETLKMFGEDNQILFMIKATTKEEWAMKTFGVYSWWWHLFSREAYKDKINRVFFSDEVEEGIKGHRRLCLHTNFLFNFQNVYDIVKCDCASTARSLFCFGAYHQYSMPLDMGFKLLRVLDALKVRFYTFPVEVLELVLLQYLALSCNGKLPTSISKLFNLQFLIIHPHTTVKYCGQTSYLPVQIWDMQELMHIEILGGNLQKPNSVISLKKLSKLLGVNPEGVTREVLKKIPNIRKLGIQIELSPNNDESNLLACFDHISEMKHLESLKCIVVNPFLTPTPVLVFPSVLKKLHLSGLGYPWEYMKVLGSLPKLKMLKLRCFAFRGPKWETENGSFMSLKYLVVEDTDLVQWNLVDGSFPKLEKLSLKHCYKLEVLQWPASHKLLKKVELVDCNPLAVASAKSLPGITTLGFHFRKLIASFDNKEL